MRLSRGFSATQMRLTSVSVTTQKTFSRPARSAASATAKKVVSSGSSGRVRVCSTTLPPKPRASRRCRRIEPNEGFERSRNG